MLSKTFFLATILCFVLSSQAQSQPEYIVKTSIMTYLGGNEFLSEERWRIRLLFIEIPMPSDQSHHHYCYQLEMHKFINELIINQPLKARFQKQSSKRQLHRSAQLILKGNEDLGKILLERGWAKLSHEQANVPEAYLDAMRSAQVKKAGMWGECDNWYQLREKLRRAGKTQYLSPVAEPYLRAGSYGWVKAIIQPNMLTLDSGQKIRLQATTSPQLELALQECWEKHTITYLEKKLVGQKVYLEPDHLQLDTKGSALIRYVWLTGNRWQSRKLLNQSLVADGWLAFDPSELNLKNVDTMKRVNSDFKERSMPPEWLGMCLNKSDVEESENKPVDKNCPIKGNVSGSKKNPKKTYHTPYSGWYSRIEAEACFENETQAQAAGFSKVK